MAYMEDSEIFHLQIDDTAKAHMLETARWTKFLAILGFIMMGLMLALGLVMGFLITSLSNTYGSGLPAGVSSYLPYTYVIIPLIYFYPIYALLKFSIHVKKGILSLNQEEFNRSLKYQKNMFRYIGILTILILILYGLILIFVATVMAVK